MREHILTSARLAYMNDVLLREKYYVMNKNVKKIQLKFYISIATFSHFLFFYPSSIIYSHFCELSLCDSCYQKLQNFCNHGSVYMTRTRQHQNVLFMIYSYAQQNFKGKCLRHRCHGLQFKKW